MKSSVLAVLALVLSASCLSAVAHPGHAAAPVEKAFLVSWIGIAPAHGVSLNPAASPDFWKKAFISKYSILGAPALLQIRAEQ
jgi:hypothetical protein